MEDFKCQGIWTLFKPFGNKFQKRYPTSQLKTKGRGLVQVQTDPQNTVKR